MQRMWRGVQDRNGSGETHKIPLCEPKGGRRRFQEKQRKKR